MREDKVAAWLLDQDPRTGSEAERSGSQGKLAVGSGEPAPTYLWIPFQCLSFLTGEVASLSRPREVEADPR